MGLSGRKVKQRIGADPRNLSWADDAARFGSNYLSKFGWDASKGLGAGGDGMKSHIKVSHKLDMLGIGAAQTKDPNGIAWKQNRDFENLLRRLNENMTEQPVASAEGEDVMDATEAIEDAEVESEEKKKKRKHEDKKDDELASKKKKKESEDKAEDDTAVQMTRVVATPESVAVGVKRVVALPRHRAHRARAIAAKNIASKSSAHISEILGIAPESQPSYPAPSTQGKLTSVEDTDALGMDKLTTSTKSLADYFKEKLNARNGSSASSSGPSAPVSTNTSSVDDDMYERPRGGIGASCLHLEIQTETKIEEETQRVGLSKFSALMSSSFLAATSSLTLATPEHEEVIREKVDTHISDVESESDAKKRRKEEKKERKKDKKKNKEEEEADVEEKSGNKKSKKDKGKGKATDETEAADARIIAASSSKKESGDIDTTEDDAEKISQKKAKTKHKSQGDSPPEEATKSKKEKKKHRKDS